MTSLISKDEVPDYLADHMERVFPDGVNGFLETIENEWQAKRFQGFVREFGRAHAFEQNLQWVDARDCYGAMMIEYPEWRAIPSARDAYIVEEYVNRAIAHHNMGVRCMRAAEYSKAINEFLLAVKINPYQEQSRFDLGLAHKFEYVADPVLNRNSKSLAREAFEHLLEINPDHEKALWQIHILDKI